MQKLNRARILLLTDINGAVLTDIEIAKVLGIASTTVRRTKWLSAAQGLQAALGYARPSREVQAS